MHTRGKENRISSRQEQSASIQSVGIVRPTRQRVAITQHCVDLSETESLNSTVTAGSIFEDLTELMTDTEESCCEDSIELGFPNAVGDPVNPSDSSAESASAGFTADSHYRILSWNCKAIRPRNE